MMYQIAVLVVMLAVAAAFAPVANRLVTKSTLSMMKKEGDTVPNVVFKARVRDDSLPGPNPFKWKDVTSADLFKGKRAVIFALPGGKSAIELSCT